VPEENTWLELHRIAENYVCSAEVARFKGDKDRLRRLRIKAAGAELVAAKGIPQKDKITVGVIALSAASLLYKAQAFELLRRNINWLIALPMGAEHREALIGVQIKIPHSGPTA